MIQNKVSAATIVFGRIIGTDSGWEQVDDYVVLLLKFKGHPDYNGPVGDITIDFLNGIIATHDNDGNITSSTDAIKAIKNCTNVIMPNEKKRSR